MGFHFVHYANPAVFTLSFYDKQMRLAIVVLALLTIHEHENWRTTCGGLRTLKLAPLTDSMWRESSKKPARRSCKLESFIPSPSPRQTPAPQRPRRASASPASITAKLTFPARQTEFPQVQAQPVPLQLTAYRPVITAFQEIIQRYLTGRRGF